MVPFLLFNFPLSFIFPIDKFSFVTPIIKSDKFSPKEEDIPYPGKELIVTLSNIQLSQLLKTIPQVHS